MLTENKLYSSYRYVARLQKLFTTDHPLVITTLISSFLAFPGDFLLFNMSGALPQKGSKGMSLVRAFREVIWYPKRKKRGKSS